MRITLSLLHFVWVARTVAQSFFAAISQFPELSNFTSFYQKNFPLASQLLTNSSFEPRTVLVPNNGAFLRYERENGYPITSLSSVDLTNLIRYHVLVGFLTAANFSASRGLTAPSILTGEQYNNRSAGSALSSQFPGVDANGQVVFIHSGLQSGGAKLIRKAGLTSFQVRSGLSSDSNLTVLDGIWDGGIIQMIDRFLTLPKNCAKTIRNQGLSSLDSAINRTHLWDDLNNSPNYTCLGPNNNAFADANHPETNLNTSALESAMKMHIISQVLYTNFLMDGQEYLSDNNMTIRVSVREKDIYFNDAKVMGANVITNNGLVHVLDRVMSPLENQTGSSTSSSTSTGNSASATSKSEAGGLSLNVLWSLGSFIGSGLLVRWLF